MGGRNLDRYLRVLEAPPEVQQAFDNNKLKLTDAARVGLLAPEQQQQIAKAIREGQDPKSAVHSRLKVETGQHKKVSAARNSLVRNLELALDDLGDRLADIRWVPPDQLEIVERGILLLSQIRDQARKTEAAYDQTSREKAFKEAVEKMAPSRGKNGLAKLGDAVGQLQQGSKMKSKRAGLPPKANSVAPAAASSMKGKPTSAQ